MTQRDTLNIFLCGCFCAMIGFVFGLYTGIGIIGIIGYWHTIRSNNA